MLLGGILALAYCSAGLLLVALRFFNAFEALIVPPILVAISLLFVSKWNPRQGT
jgi:hypothetical protein